MSETRPMTPAVPDPTVEAPEITVAIKAQNPDLETAWRTIAWWEQTCDYWYEQTKDARARAAAPDALRVRVEALAAEWERFTGRARPAFLVAADELRELLVDPHREGS